MNLGNCILKFREDDISSQHWATTAMKILPGFRIWTTWVAHCYFWSKSNFEYSTWSIMLHYDWKSLVFYSDNSLMILSWLKKLLTWSNLHTLTWDTFANTSSRIKTCHLQRDLCSNISLQMCNMDSILQVDHKNILSLLSPTDLRYHTKGQRDSHIDYTYSPPALMPCFWIVSSAKTCCWYRKIPPSLNCAVIDPWRDVPLKGSKKKWKDHLKRLLQIYFIHPEEF